MWVFAHACKANRHWGTTLEFSPSIFTWAQGWDSGCQAYTANIFTAAPGLEPRVVSFLSALMERELVLVASSVGLGGGSVELRESSRIQWMAVGLPATLLTRAVQCSYGGQRRRQGFIRCLKSWPSSLQPISLTVEFQGFRTLKSHHTLERKAQQRSAKSMW